MLATPFLRFKSVAIAEAATLPGHGRISRSFGNPEYYIAIILSLQMTGESQSIRDQRRSNRGISLRKLVAGPGLEPGTCGL